LAPPYKNRVKVNSQVLATATRDCQIFIAGPYPLSFRQLLPTPTKVIIRGPKKKTTQILKKTISRVKYSMRNSRVTIGHGVKPLLHMEINLMIIIQI
jgi:hypothetical protein